MSTRQRPDPRAALLRAVAFMVVVGAALALGAAAARAQAPPMGAPTLEVTGRVRWTAPAVSAPAWVAGFALPPASASDSLALWTRAALEPDLRDVALAKVAELRLLAGDSTGADSCWEMVGERSLWAWGALRHRADLALARGDTAAADSLLEQAPRDGWPEADRAAWLAWRVALRAALGDTTHAAEFARQAVSVYPSDPSTAAALVALDAMLAARRDSLAGADERRAAEVDAARGDWSSAARRLRRVLARLSGDERDVVARRLTETLRGGRHPVAAAAAGRMALAAASDSLGRAAATIECARVARDAGAADSALALYARATMLSSDAWTLDTATWEAARYAESLGRWATAGARYARGAASRSRRAAAAAFRAGLVRLAAGAPDSACAWWSADTSDASLFWWGVTRRARGDGVAGDSALARVAGRPGFSFYRAAARDTLGIRGWPARVAVGACADSATCAPLALARTLIGLGAPDEASLLIARWSADDPRLTGGRAASPLGARLEAARLAFAAGRIGQGIGLADAASRAPEEDAARFGGEDAWAITPWIFPPAFESLMVAPRDSAAALEPALLWAVATQESRFDPRARSRSGALGLLQLKLDAARDVARWRRDPPPSESTLVDPATSVTYGARYLKRLAGRFEGSLAVALIAYNTGGSTVPRWWRDLLGRGGEALFCELVPSGGEYAKRILGYRQAYRELRPTATVR